MSHLKCLVAVCLLFPACLLAQTPKNARDYLKRGLSHYNKGDLEGAVNDFTKALEINPEMADAQVARGKALRLKGDFDGAINDFEDASETNKQLLANNAEVAAAYASRGNLRVNAFDIDGAVADFDKAVKYDPGNADSIVKRGEAKLIRGDLTDAIADFNAGLVLHPDKLQSSLALAGRGYANFLVGNETEAERDFEQSVNLNNEGKFFLTLHLKLLESKIKELKRRQEANQQLIAGHFVPNHVGQATAY